MRAPALILCLAALPCAAEPPDRNAEVTRWFAHCAAFDSRAEVVQDLALLACVDQSVQMCRTVEAITPGSGCFDGLEAAARAEQQALIPALQAIDPATGFDRKAIEAELERLSAHLPARDCPDSIARLECAAFLALVDWSDTRSVLYVRRP